MVELRIVEPGILDHRAVGALEAAEEIIEARMRATRNPAPALRLTFYERDLHGLRPDTSRDGRCGPNVPAPSPVRPMGQTQQTH